MPEDTDDETGQVLRGMDSLPPALRRYVHADNCWFQQEISEWEEQFCQSPQVQQVQQVHQVQQVQQAGGPQEEEPVQGSGPEAARQTPVKREPGAEELTASEPRLATRSEEEEEEKEEVAEEEEEKEPARQEAEEG